MILNGDFSVTVKGTYLIRVSDVSPRECESVAHGFWIKLRVSIIFCGLVLFSEKMLTDIYLVSFYGFAMFVLYIKYNHYLNYLYGFRLL